MPEKTQLSHCRNCGSPEVELRQRRLRDGQQQYLGQCQRCGQGTKAVPQPAPWSDEYYAPAFDPDLRAAARTSEPRAIAGGFDGLRQHSPAWRERYEAHLASEKWARLRAKVMTRAAGQCEGCLEAPAVEVHHLTYKHLGDELLWELVAVCRECHQRCHPHQD